MKLPETKYALDDFVEVKGQILKVLSIELEIGTRASSKCETIIRYFLANDSWYAEADIKRKVIVQPGSEEK